MPQPVQFLRRFLPFISFAVLAAVAYDGWIFFSRWQSQHDAVEEESAAEARRDRQSIDMLGGTDFRIINFYAVPQTVRRGEQARICFGVYGAKHVRIEPAPGDVHPAVSDCEFVVPHDNTVYTLTADDGAGHTATSAVTVAVTR